MPTLLGTHNAVILRLTHAPVTGEEEGTGGDLRGKIGGKEEEGRSVGRGRVVLKEKGCGIKREKENGRIRFEPSIHHLIFHNSFEA